jgi:hypothetical protein
VKTKKAQIVLIGVIAFLIVGVAGLIIATPSKSLAVGATITTQVGRATTQGPAASILATRAAMLRSRIEQILTLRKQRFDTVEAGLTNHIQTVKTVADKVAKAGGDTSAAETALQQAGTDLATATSLENQAVDQFRAIPGSTNRPAAFLLARVTAKDAVSHLRAARTDILEAMTLLRQQVRTIRRAGATTTSVS